MWPVFVWCRGLIASTHSRCASNTHQRLVWPQVVAVKCKPAQETTNLAPQAVQSKEGARKGDSARPMRPPRVTSGRESGSRPEGAPAAHVEPWRD